jgi:hypothetical protein
MALTDEQVGFGQSQKGLSDSDVGFGQENPTPWRNRPIFGSFAEGIPSGADSTVPALTIPISTVAKTAGQALDFLTTPSGAAQTAAAAAIPITRAPLAVKWGWDMLKSGASSAKNLGNDLANLISDSITKGVVSHNDLGIPKDASKTDVAEHVQDLADDAAGVVIGGLGAGTLLHGIKALPKTVSELKGAPDAIRALKQQTGSEPERVEVGARGLPTETGRGDRPVGAEAQPEQAPLSQPSPRQGEGSGAPSDEVVAREGPSTPGVAEMGAAGVKEIPETGQGADIYGIAQRVREERAKAGAPTVTATGEGISVPESIENGREILNKDPEAVNKAWGSFASGKRMSAEDMGAMRAQGERLAQEANRAEEQHGTNSPEYRAAADAAIEHEAKIKAMQTEWHRLGMAQQGATDIDTGSVIGLEKSYASDTGKRFTPEQTTQAKEKSSAVRKATEATGEANARLTKALSKVADDDPSKPVWKKVRELLDKGMRGLDDIRTKVATDLGMTDKEVTDLIAKKKDVKRVADEVWDRQRKERELRHQARAWLFEQQIPEWRRLAGTIPRAMFKAKVLGHATVALGTHAPMVAFQPQYWGTYLNDFGKMYKLAFKPRYHEMQMQELIRRPNYFTARRGGLVNDPFQYEDYTDPRITAYMGKLTGAGNRGYDVLKILRQDLFDRHWNGLSPELQTPEMAKLLSQQINHITGTVSRGVDPRFATVFFAPRLELSRLAWLFRDPAKMVGTFTDWKNATPEEKVIARKEALQKLTVIATGLSLLGLNQALLSATGSDQKINLSDPLRSDFGKFKGFGLNISYGNPMLTMARLPIRLVHAVSGPGGKLRALIYPDEDVYSILGEYARSQLSPFASLASTLFFGMDWQRRPLPYSERPVPKRLKAQGVGQYTWPEFLSEVGSPIPFEEAVRQVWHNGFGLSDQDIESYMKALATLTFMGGTGGRVSGDYESQANPFQQ